MKISRASMLTGKVTTMDLDITTEQLERWINGELIQDVFPHLTLDEREFLKTGITYLEWDSLNKEEDVYNGDEEDVYDGGDEFIYPDNER